MRTVFSLAKDTRIGCSSQEEHNDCKTDIHKSIECIELIYIWNGEFAAFIIAWNSIMKNIVGIALLSKMSILFFNELALKDSNFNLIHIVSMSWIYSDHFDLIGFFVANLFCGK